MEKNNLPDRRYKVMTINVLSGLGKNVGELSENVNKERANLKKNHQT